LTHIRDRGAVFDRVRVHWSIHAEMSYFVHLCMDYEDRNWFKLDTEEIKIVEKSVSRQQCYKKYRELRGKSTEG
jgi:hypothetical protein